MSEIKPIPSTCTTYGSANPQMPELTDEQRATLDACLNGETPVVTQEMIAKLRGRMMETGTCTGMDPREDVLGAMIDRIELTEEMKRTLETYFPSTTSIPVPKLDSGTNPFQKLIDLFVPSPTELQMLNRIDSGSTTFDLADAISNAPTFSPTEQQLMGDLKDRASTLRGADFVRNIRG